MKERNTKTLEQALGHCFRRPELLEQALTHSSQARERESLQSSDASRVGDNEQMEFLGDAVLGLITSEELFRRLPQFREGELSKLRAHLVSEKHLIQAARKLELGEYLFLGRGEEKSGGRNKTALLVDTLEAVLGAIYLDGGLEASRRLVIGHIIAPELERLAQNGSSLPRSDYKSTLQEVLQASGGSQASYLLVEEQGPEHNKTFTVEARLEPGRAGGPGPLVARAKGSTKKSAEQEAARQILEHLDPSRKEGDRPSPRVVGD